MIFTPADLDGAFVIEADRSDDERGFFARTFSEGEFAARGLDARVAQTLVQPPQGQLRGLHYQVGPHAQAKLVRCLRGAVYDVAVDLRADSPTYRRWFGTELNEGGLRAFYVPAGCAHGFLTLKDNTEVAYQMSRDYHPASECGVRWDDPTLAIRWPAAPTVVSARDRSLPRLDAAELP